MSYVKTGISGMHVTAVIILYKQHNEEIFKGIFFSFTFEVFGEFLYISYQLNKNSSDNLIWQLCTVGIKDGTSVIKMFLLISQFSKNFVMFWVS